MSEKIKVADMLYGYGKSDIRCLGSATAYISMTGPAGIGRSSKRPKSAKNAVKYNGLMAVMDNLLIDKKVNAVASDDTVYTEFDVNGETYKVTFNGTEMSFEHDAPENNYNICTPIVMYALSDNCDAPEFKENFRKAVEAYNATSALPIAQALALCDSFYYEVCNSIQDVTLFKEDIIPETIKQAYVSDMFDEMDELEDLELPTLSILEGIESHKASKKGKKKVDTGFESCLDGSHIIPYEWSDEQKLKIPELSSLENFVPNDVFYSLLRKIEHRTGKILDRMELGKSGINAIGDDYINTLVVGKPGTGKTTVAYALGAALGLPVYTVAITKNTEEDTFQGQTKVVEGKFDFVSTDFLKAFTQGGIIVLEEINLADPAVIMGSLGQAIEFPFILMRDGYESVQRHPMCIVLGTMNVGTAGSKDISEALSSRFKQTYMLGDPDEAQFIDILKKKSSFEGNTKIYKWVYDSFNKIITYLKSPSVNQEEMCLLITTRGCIGALQNIEEGDTPKQALINTLCGKIAEKDLFLYENIIKDVINVLPNMTV